MLTRSRPTLASRGAIAGTLILGFNVPNVLATVRALREKGVTSISIHASIRTTWVFGARLGEPCAWLGSKTPTAMC